jgi:hypothetical protein
MEYAELDGCLINQDGLEICIKLAISDPSVKEADILARDIFDFVQTLIEPNQLADEPCDDCVDGQCVETFLGCMGD